MVTGGSGFIGTHFIERLCGGDVEILNVDGKAPNIDAHRAFWQCCDIKHHEDLLEIFSRFAPTHVLHLAAKANLNGRTIADFPDNTAGTQSVVDCVRATPSVKRYMHTSTQYVVRPGVFPESDEYLLPYTPYGESKAESESILRGAELDCEWVVVRPTNIWGPWHTAFPFELWRYLGKRYYVHPGFRPIRKYYGYVGNVVSQMHQLLFDVPAESVDRRVFYVTDAPMDNADWMNAFSVAFSGSKIRRIPRSLWQTMAIVGDAVKAVGGRFPVDSDRYFRLTVEEALPYERTFALTGTPEISFDEGVGVCIDWVRNTHPSIIQTAR